MKHRAIFDAASCILAGEIHNKKKTVTDISTPCRSACVDNNGEKTRNDITLLLLFFGGFSS